MEKKGSRNSGAQQAKRILAVASRLVRGMTVDVPSLAAEFRVHIRTIKRDLEALQSAGIPLEFDDRLPRPQPRLAGGSITVPAVRLSSRERVALHLSALSWSHAKPLGDDAKRAVEKIESSLGASPAPADGAFQRLVKGEKLLSQASSHLLLLLEAIVRKHCCRVSYTSVKDGQKSPARLHLFEPRRIVEFGGSLYCLGTIPPYKRLCILALDRMDSVKVEIAPRRELPELDLDAWLQESFGVMWAPPQEVRLRFARHQAIYVQERIWHPSQQIQVRPDGSLDVMLVASPTIEMVRWILSWGDAVTVRQPKSLRTEVVNALRQALMNYTVSREDTLD